MTVAERRAGRGADPLKRRNIGRAVVAVLISAILAAPFAVMDAWAYEQREEIVAWGHGYNGAQYLVVHETANPGASAWNHVLYWSGSPDYAVHYVMELDGSTVYRTVPDDRLAWHVGNGNYATVGIELAHATTAEEFSEQWREAVSWCGDYLHTRGWGIDRLLSHNECRSIWGGTDHTDPVGYFAQYGKTWGEFKSAVETYMRTGQAEDIDVPGGGSGGGSSTGGVQGEGFGGMYTCNADVLNIRDGIWGNVVGSYYYGETVVLDDWYAVDGGMVWGRYTSWGGATRYVAVGPHTGSPEAGDYLVKGGTSQGGASYGSGWRTVTADVLNVRDGIWGNVVASYGYGQTVYIERVAYGADGSAWGVYTSWSGHTRYVSMDYLA